MKDYLYLKCEVLLLDDVFEKIKGNCLKIVDYDQAIVWVHQLGMQCSTRQKFSLNLIYMLKYICSLRKVMRGRISFISRRYIKSNNKYLKRCEPIQESKHILYFDANNLYGSTMSKFLSKGRFKWPDSKEYDLNKEDNYFLNSTQKK